jgi:hypothetical protein
MTNNRGETVPQILQRRGWKLCQRPDQTWLPMVRGRGPSRAPEIPAGLETLIGSRSGWPTPEAAVIEADDWLDRLERLTSPVRLAGEE